MPTTSFAASPLNVERKSSGLVTSGFAGNPVILDDGEETLRVETDADVHLGQEVTVRGRRDGETFVAEELG